MESKQVLGKVAETVTAKPFEISVDIKPQSRWHGLLQKTRVMPVQKKYAIAHITIGNLLRISKILLGIGANVFDSSNLLQSNYQSIADDGRALAHIVAIAIKNKKQEPSEKEVDFIQHNFTAKELMDVLAVVIGQMDLTSFMSAIILVKGLNILEAPTASATSVPSSEMNPTEPGS